MQIPFKEKVGANEFGKLLNKYWADSFKEKDIVEFNFIITHWITAEALTFIFSWIIELKYNHKKVKVILPHPYPNISGDYKNDETHINKRKRRLASIIDIWKIEKACGLKIGKEIIVPSNLKSILDEERAKYYFYDLSWYRILPFQKEETNIYRDVENIRTYLDDKITNIFNLEAQTLEILNLFNSHKPFENHTLSHLFTIELFLNTVYHSNANNCYFSIALNSKYDEEIISNKLRKEYSDEKEIKVKTTEKINKFLRYTLPKSIQEERISEVQSFFKKNNNYLNRSYLEFNYVDFGEGISNTLAKEFNKLNDKQKDALVLFKNKSINKDSKILEYAFLLDSSKDQFDKRLGVNNYLPRGLYFLIEVVKRYEGLIIARSKRGKVIYDFSSTNKTSSAIIPCDSACSFPGTMITIFIPNTSKNNYPLNNSEGAIESYEFREKIYKQEPERRHINIGLILSEAYEKVRNSKSIRKNIFIYNYLFSELNKILQKYNSNENNRFLIFIDFAGINESYIENKIFFYLANTPLINEFTNVIIININNSFSKRLEEINEIIKNSRPFHFRPIPCLLYSKVEGVTVKWIGLANKDNEEKLTNLLLLGSSENFLYVSDVNNPDLIKGNIFKIDWIDKTDNSGNIYLTFLLPDLREIQYEACFSTSDRLVKRIIQRHDVWLHKKGTSYLTSGGYYQYQFLNFYELLTSIDKNSGIFYSKSIARYLVNKWLFEIKELPERLNWIVSVTLSGQIIAREILKEIIWFYRESESKPKLLRLAHYYEFENEEYGLDSISKGDNVLIVTDVISTGDLITRLTNSIENRASTIINYLSIADIRIEEKYKNDLIDSKLISLIVTESFKKISEFNFTKYDEKFDKNDEVVKINPIINAPVTKKLTDNKSIVNKVLFDFNEFINSHISVEHLLIGYFKNNNSFHAYFFDTNNYFKTNAGKEFLNLLVKKINKNFDIIVFPIFSGIESINEWELKEIVNNDKLKVLSFPRVDTPMGWRFTFPAESLNHIFMEQLGGKGEILILDDGSCSGDTIIQLIDSITFFEISSITVLSIFGRLRDFQREFFTKLSGIESKIKLTVLFGLHAHIPFYPFQKSFPLSAEYNQLRNINTHELTVDALKEYVTSRLNSIRANSIRDDDKKIRIIPEYFPTINNQVDIKRIFILRDKIGRLEHYRLYKEYYSDFHIKNKTDDELILAIILHEPSLITTIKHIVPEVYKRLFKLIKNVTIQDLKYKLYYKWKPISLIRLLYIFNSELLFSKENLLKILENYNLDNEVQKFIGFLLYDKIKKENDIKMLIMQIAFSLNEKKLLDASIFKELSIIIEKEEELINAKYAFSKISLFWFDEHIFPNHSELLLIISDITLDIQNNNRNKQQLDSLKLIINDNIISPLEKIKEYKEVYKILKYYRLKEIYDISKELITVISKENNNAELLTKLKSFELQITDNSWKELILGFNCDILKVWQTCIHTISNSKINFNVDSIDSKELLVPIHVKCIERVFNYILDNLVRESKSKEVNISYKVDNSKKSFKIIQDFPFNDNDIQGGLKRIERIMEAFGGKRILEKTSYKFGIKLTFK